MDKILFTILFCIWTHLLFAQFFNGDLVYNFQTNDTLRDHRLGDLGITMEPDIQNSKRYINIKNKEFISYNKNASGKTKSVEIQVETNPSIYLSGKLVDFNSLYPLGIDYTLIETSDEYKQILNKKCRKYVYQWNQTIITAWIPDDEKYIDTYELGSLFRKYFFTEGLAYEINQTYKKITNTLTLIEKTHEIR